MVRGLLGREFAGVNHCLHDGVIASQPLQLAVPVQVGAAVTEVSDDRARVADHRGNDGGVGAGEQGLGATADEQVVAHLCHRAAQPLGHLRITQVQVGEVARHITRQHLHDHRGSQIAVAGAAHAVGDHVEPQRRVRSPPVVVARALTSEIAEPGIGHEGHSYITSGRAQTSATSMWDIRTLQHVCRLNLLPAGHRRPRWHMLPI